MRKTLRVLLLLTLLFQYTIPITTIAQENNSSYSSSSNSEEVNNEQKEKQTTETSSSEEKTQQTTDEIKKNQTETNNQENSNAPPIVSNSEKIIQSENNISQENGNLDEDNQQNYEKSSALQRAASDAPSVLPDGVGFLKIDKNNFLDYFTLNGSASYNKSDGVLTVTPNDKYKVGSATFNKKILFSQDITINVDANIGNKSKANGGADGILIGFHDAGTNVIGGAGNGFGLGRLPGSIGFKLDTYYNDVYGVVGKAEKDPSRFNNKSFGGFIAGKGDADNTVYTLDDANRYGNASLPQEIGQPNNDNFNNLNISYNSASRLFQSTYNDNGNPKSWSVNMNNLPENVFNSSSPKAKSLIFAGSTGGHKNLQQYKINEILISVPVVEKVDEDDESIKLEGAVFDLYNESNQKIKSGLTTDSNGYIYLRETLENGNYYLVESRAPNGYEPDYTTKHSLTINNENEASYIAATIKNKKIPGKLETKKIADKDAVYKGDTVNYTLNVKNVGKEGSSLTNVKVEDVLPDGLILNKDSLLLNGYPVTNESQSENDISVTIKKILKNEDYNLTFSARVNKNPISTIKNIAIVIDPLDPNNPQKPEKEIIVIQSPGKLATEETVYDKDGNSVGNQKVKVGDIIEYRINARNTEGAETIVNNVKVSDEIPAGLSYQAGSLKVTMPDGSTKALSDEQVNGQTLATGDLGSLKGGEGVTVSFKVKVTEKATGTIKNIAKVDGNVPPETPGDPDKPITPETPEVPVGVPGEVTGEKLVNGQTSSTSYVGDVVTYTIRLSHTKGTGEWTGSIKDKLPENMSYQAGTTTFNGTAVKDEDVWKEGTLTVPNVTVNDTNETAEVTFKAKINKEALGTTVKNKAEATPNTPSDPNNPNTPDIPEVPSKVVPSAGKLATEKTVYDKDGNSVGNQKVKVGDIIEYRINARNTEGAETIVNNVKVSDEIPAGLSYQAGSLKVTMPDGSTKALSDEQVNGQTLATGDLGSLKGGERVTVSFKVKVTEKATGTVTNVATVDGNVPPTTPGEPDIPLTPGKPRVVTNISRKKETNTPLSVPPRSRENLPNTGEKLSYILPVSGVVIVLFVARYKLKRRK